MNTSDTFCEPVDGVRAYRYVHRGQERVALHLLQDVHTVDISVEEMQRFARRLAELVS